MSDRTKLIWSGLLGSLLGGVNAVWTIVNLARGEILTAVVTLGCAAFAFGLVLPLARTVPGEVRVRGTFDTQGTTLRPDRLVDVSVQVALMGLALAGLTLAIYTSSGRVQVPEQARLQLPFVGGLAALVTVPLCVRNLRRGSVSYVYLSPLGFEMVEGWRPGSAQWSEVRAVSDADPRRPKAFRGGVVITLADDSVVGMSAGSFTPDGTAVREMVRFYWQNRTRRDELTDGRALKRLADNRFDVL